MVPCNISRSKDKLVIIGYFSFNVESLNNAVAQSFLLLMESFGLTQSIDSPTHIKGSLKWATILFRDHVSTLFEVTTTL